MQKPMYDFDIDTTSEIKIIFEVVFLWLNYLNFGG